MDAKIYEMIKEARIYAIDNAQALRWAAEVARHYAEIVAEAKRPRRTRLTEACLVCEVEEAQKTADRLARILEDVIIIIEKNKKGELA